MSTHNFTVFKPYPFKKGQKIRIEGGRRRGDWEVAGITDSKVTLRCPHSGQEVCWTRFCYFTEAHENEVWPLDDQGHD